MLNSDYILGLVDGEGSFTVYVRNPNSKKIVARRVRVEPRFYLKLQQKDKKMLYEMKSFFHCGNVYFQKDMRENHQNCYRYEVTKRDSLNRIIIPFFRKNRLKLFSKRKDFDIFCIIMEKIEKGKHLTELGLREIYNLKQSMH